MSDENEYDEEVSYEIVEQNPQDSGKPGMLNSISNVVSGSKDLVSKTGNLVSNVGGIVQTVQQQKTIREEIRKKADATIKQIEAQTKTLNNVVDKTFAERKENFKVMHEAVRDAMKRGDNQALAAALGSIVEGQKNSVIKDIGETLKLGQNNQKQLSLNRDEEMEI